MGVKYEIRPGKTTPCELWKIKTTIRGTHETHLMQGTHTECQRILKEITNE